MTLPEYQEQLFRLLCIIDDICSKNKIRYALAYGAAIGTLRGGDFIPWDDDIDLTVLREDLDAFREAMKRELPEPIVFLDYKDHGGLFFDFISKIIDPSVEARPATEEDLAYGPYQNKLSIDIFVVDKAPDKPLSQKLFLLRYKLLYGLAMSRRYKRDTDGYSLIQKLGTGVLSAAGKMISLETIFQWYEKAMTRFSGKETGFRYISCALLILRYQQIFPAEDFASEYPASFHGREFPLHAGTSDILTRIYGDYMTPPEDRSAFISHAEYGDENHA